MKRSPFSGQKKKYIKLKKRKSNGKTNKKTYSNKRFNEIAVKLVIEGVKSQRRIVNEIGVNVNNLQKCKKEYLNSHDPERVRQKAEGLEIRRLRKELKEAYLELEILIKRSHIFLESIYEV